MVLHSQGQVIPFVYKAIETPNDVATCNAAISCLSDLLFMVDENERDSVQRQNSFNKILCNRDHLIDSILESIKSPSVSRDIKPSLFTCLSCFFWVVSDFCIGCIPRCLAASLDASRYELDTFDEESKEWVNKLYSSIVDLWDSMSAAANRNPNAIQNALPTILEFINRIVNLDYICDQLIKNCVLMLRDLGYQLRSYYAKLVRGFDEVSKEQILDNPGTSTLFSRCMNIDNESESIAQEAYTTLKTVSNGTYTSW